MKSYSDTIIQSLEKKRKTSKFPQSIDHSLQLIKMEARSDTWTTVSNARDKNRLSTLECIETIFDDFVELHGDRLYGDDPSIVGGIARLGHMPVTVIGIVKGKDVEENIHRNFGMPHPEGYRKSQRLMKQAEKFNRPIVTFIDTPGAYPGIGAEERGQASAIAENIRCMLDLQVPVIAIILGEAGSGGAIALACANEVWMMDQAIYSILSPEGFASILYKDATKAKDASDIMKITSQDMLKLGVVEEVFPENENTASLLKGRLIESLSAFRSESKDQLKKQRNERFRVMGDVLYDK